MKNKRKIWTTEEDALMLEKFPFVSTKLIAEELGRTYTMVGNRAFFLGLKKDPEYIKSMQLELSEKLKINGKAYRFQTNNVPANKGKKMPDEVYEKASKTMFKKGNKPLNTKEGNGHITIRMDKRSGRSYKYIKLGDSKWDLLHRVVWKNAHGPIDRRTMVTFKDGDSMNCDIDNLETITLKENRVRNAGWSTLNDDYLAGLIARNSRQIDYGLVEKVKKIPELLELKKSQILLKRQINGTSK